MHRQKARPTKTLSRATALRPSRSRRLLVETKWLVRGSWPCIASPVLGCRQLPVLSSTNMTGPDNLAGPGLQLPMSLDLPAAACAAIAGAAA